MEPVFQHGHTIIVSNQTLSIEMGETVAYWIEGRKLPFVYRVIEERALI